MTESLQTDQNCSPWAGVRRSDLLRVRTCFSCSHSSVSCPVSHPGLAKTATCWKTSSTHLGLQAEGRQDTSEHLRWAVGASSHLWIGFPSELKKTRQNTVVGTVREAQTERGTPLCVWIIFPRHAHDQAQTSHHLVQATPHLLQQELHFPRGT